MFAKFYFRERMKRSEFRRKSIFNAVFVSSKSNILGWADDLVR